MVNVPYSTSIPEEKRAVKVIIEMKDGSQQEYSDFLLLVGREGPKTPEGVDYMTGCYMHATIESPDKIAALVPSLAMLTTLFLKTIGQFPPELDTPPVDNGGKQDDVP